MSRERSIDRQELHRRQRVVRRNRVFVLLPALAVLVSSIVLVWEIVRSNLPQSMLPALPWRLRILDIQSATTAVTVFGALLVARLQYARTVRPALGWRIRRLQTDLLPTANDERPWVVDVFNGGGGPAVIESIEYHLDFEGAPKRLSGAWHPAQNVIGTFNDHGLVFGRDYVVGVRGSGGPLPPATELDQGQFLAAFTDAVIRSLHHLDIRVRVSDSVGDVHERLLDCSQMLPPPMPTDRSHEQLAAPGTRVVDHSVTVQSRP
jgi:hypothetical protein